MTLPRPWYVKQAIATFLPTVLLAMYLQNLRMNLRVEQEERKEELKNDAAGGARPAASGPQSGIRDRAQAHNTASIDKPAAAHAAASQSTTVDHAAIAAKQAQLEKQIGGLQGELRALQHESQAAVSGTKASDALLQVRVSQLEQQFKK